MVDYVLHAEPGKYTLQGADVNLSVERISEAVELEYKLPPDIKMAVKDFIKSVFDNATDLANDLVVNIPDSLALYSESIIDIIKLLIAG
jgi:hypothetical protein